ncbi:helix-turn-helix domain-containing protein [Isoptericola sp. b441]|uniref:Helix-turn-helix domain-containing protein n=1 Tax=Actinotalea lenta TaxID=3064654 RepID=A0ABT9D9C6_9CELL|nr:MULTISPECIES: helix-turn-helix domain-containing protein [unclassified Isoptericola]MDO8105911.1 helix-turn-helix domain-containing protein [Isoptericola sp. b441]MDO8122626.1 helix-turn-helix domain-containing protein [Isoptericola sp. b490]
MSDATPPRPGPEALKAFVHPLRVAMFDRLRDHGPATATQLAQALGESTGQTSYHLRQLARHGFVEDDPGHAGGRERWWRPVSFTVDGDDLADDDVRRAVTSLLGTRMAARVALQQRWLDGLGSDDPSWRRAGMATEGSTWLTAEELDRLTTDLEDTLARHLAAAKAHRDSGDSAVRRRVRVYLDAFPLPPDDEGDPGDTDG